MNGKGSKRRPEDYRKVCAGLDSIDWSDNGTIPCPNEDCMKGYVQEICIGCDGSGEGRYDGTRCMTCGGSGCDYVHCMVCDGAGEIDKD